MTRIRPMPIAYASEPDTRTFDAVHRAACRAVEGLLIDGEPVKVDGGVNQTCLESATSRHWIWLSLRGSFGYWHGEFEVTGEDEGTIQAAIQGRLAQLATAAGKV